MELSEGKTKIERIMELEHAMQRLKDKHFDDYYELRGMIELLAEHLEVEIIDAPSLKPVHEKGQV